jgi:arylsulfatase A-like enzyme
MSRRILDSPWPYFVVAGVLVALAVASQFEIRTPSRKKAPVERLLDLRARDDLNVVFLLIDTLRADRLGIYGYERPTSTTIDELARYGVVFENVVSQSSWTKTSMASLWTATHPINNGILRYNHVLPDEAVVPAEIFQQAGYRTVGLWRNGWVEPNFGFAQGFDVYVRPTPGAARARMQRRSHTPEAALTGSDEDLTISAIDFLEQFGQERFFLYLHYMDIHQYVYDEQAAIFGTSYSDAYDQAIHWTDRLVGSLLSTLDAIGVLDRTLIVIASDHGEAFREHGFEGHARNLYHEVVNVPFILLPPFLLEPGIRVRETISNADIWPTLLDIVGLPPIPGADGRSMLPLVLKAGGARNPPSSDGLARPVFAQITRGWGNPKAPANPLVSVTHEGRRLMAYLDDSEKVEYYDRRADPGETRDLWEERREEAQPLRDLVSRYRDEARSPWGVAPEEVELDELRLNHLRALGYVIKP